MPKIIEIFWSIIIDEIPWPLSGSGECSSSSRGGSGPQVAHLIRRPAAAAAPPLANETLINNLTLTVKWYSIWGFFVFHKVCAEECVPYLRPLLPPGRSELQIRGSK